MECVVFVGIQATGKSSFFKARFFRSHVRVNLDMLKTRHRERRLVETCLEIQQPFVVDNTNPTREDRQRYILPAKAAGFSVSAYYFQSRLSEALERNLQRPVDEQIVDKGVRGTAARMVLPSYSEGFDQLYYVSLNAGEFKVEAWSDEI